LLDKRAIKAEELYKKNEEEAAKLLQKLDFDKIEKENKEIIEDIGNCPLTVCNVIEAM
jgi:hypothetical protein